MTEGRIQTWVKGRGKDDVLWFSDGGAAHLYPLVRAVKEGAALIS